LGSGGAPSAPFLFLSLLWDYKYYIFPIVMAYILYSYIGPGVKIYGESFSGRRI
jgi:hypothetical protein